MSIVRLATSASVKPITGLMNRDDELSRRRHRVPLNGRGDKDLYQVKLSLERIIKRATLQHKLLCISIERMENDCMDLAPGGCSGAPCNAEDHWKPWSPNKLWALDGDDESLDR
jgi:hypothetical protein